MSIVIEAVLILVLAGVAAIVVALAVKLFRAISRHGGGENDTRLVQEVYQGLSRLERRIDALETILLDPKRKEPEE